ncbi:phage tail protein [Bacillus thermotolerans]|uniref:Phage endopeptidase n=1 Tax=Bacillus thermotolerans TaxID=1221996 RepID=A0A0F5HN27_BACTR|nr:phage tail protein [Bacillus thermotolerans]KKB34653.1 Phage endopeptidase [Bacillus thermotolerans]KKB38573.1 Phage endopeptidase [Bacillus thermotolerans]
MLSVTNLNGITEPLTNIQGAEIEEEVNGGFTLSFASFFDNNPGYELLEEESVVELDGHEFTVKHMTEENGWKEIVAEHVYFSLIDSWQPETFGGARTIEELAPFILDGTGWTWEVESGIPAAFVPNFGDDNRLSLSQTACEAFECEVKILPGRHLRYAKEIGQDRDGQLRIGHNIVTLRRTIDTTKLVTVGRGHGANGLKVEWRSPNIAIYGERYGEPIVDERFTVADHLREKVRQETQDVPETTIELTIAEIRKAGYENPIELGDWIWLIDEDKDLIIHVRVAKIKRFPFENKSPVITLSNVEKKASDILTEVRVEIDENMRQHRSRIDQTNERITLEVQRLDGEFIEAYSLIELTAEQIRSEVVEYNKQLENGISDNTSSITQLANEITSRVTMTAFEQGLQKNLNDANTYADQREAAANEYTDGRLVMVDERLTSAESSITQLANSITLKVDQTVYENGILNAQTYAELEAAEAEKNAKAYAETQANNARDAAQDYADGLKASINSDINNVKQSITDLEGTINSSFKDGVIQESEARAIEKYINSLAAEKADLDGRYNTIYSNIELTGASKTDLATAKASYDSAYTTLINSINIAIADGKTNSTEKADVDAKFKSYQTAISILAQRLDEAIDAIAQVKADAAEFDANQYTDSQMTIVNGEISDVSGRITSLNEYIDGSFKDGVISTAEREALSSHIQQLNNEKAGLDSQYTAIYSDTQLTGTEKTSLASAKTAYDTSHASLIDAINTAIVDNTVTTEEKMAVDNAFAFYRTALGTLQQRFEEAVKVIAQAKADAAEDAANSYTNGITSPMVTRITEAESSIIQLSNEISSKVSEDVYLTDQVVLQGNIDDLESTASSLAFRVSSAESEIKQQASQISSKVSYTDFNGNEVMSRINQTATTIKMDAQKIEMTGITEVANQLHIGGRGTWGDKSLIFSNDSGIDSWNSRSMSLVALGGNIHTECNEFRFDSYFPGSAAVLNIGTAADVIWGKHAPPAPSYVASAGNADRLDGYHASYFSVSGHNHDSRYSRIGHSHYGDYVRDYFGQYLDLYIDNATNRLVVRRNGSIVGSVALT